MFTKYKNVYMSSNYKIKEVHSNKESLANFLDWCFKEGEEEKDYLFFLMRNEICDQKELGILLKEQKIRIGNVDRPRRNRILKY